eukprot:354083-Chlamydomonas_euryale.AAC.5
MLLMELSHCSACDRTGKAHRILLQSASALVGWCSPQQWLSRCCFQAQRCLKCAGQVRECGRGGGMGAGGS